MLTDSARRDLAAWRAARPDDAYAADRHLRAVNRRHLGDERWSALEARAGVLGRDMSRIAELAERYEQHPPELMRWDGFGDPVERIEFDPAYHEAGRLAWRSGVVSLAGEPGASFEHATLLYLLSGEGEMGHCCPATCTVGLVRALRRRAAPEVAARFLPPLLEPDYDRAERGAQFLTEVQGGSDVGANVATAAAAGDGTFRLTGEKWFCSVADADQFLVTARPEGGAGGTAGLGCFVVPRLVDGRPNGFSLRRLKEKLGTRAMASAEIDFAGAVAYPVGPLEEGFKTAVTAMLNGSRWLNAVGNTGMLRRAYLEASSYANHRRAFGHRIGEFPAVRATLAAIKVEWLAALHSTWLLTAVDEAVDTGEADADTAGWHRFLVNANKYVVATKATGAVRQAIEILGGNGAIETFSPLPRLLRDSVVYEQWEGTHNVLAAQVLRDLSRLGLAGLVFERVARMIKGVGHPELGPAVATAAAALEDLQGLVPRAVADPEYGAQHFRGFLERLMRIVQVAAVMQAGDAPEEPDLGGELRAVADLMARTDLDREYAPEDDPRYGERISLVLRADIR